jgi:hypothetical protein
MVSVETPNLKAFTTRPPRTRVGIVRLLWPTLKACLDAGHSLRDIHQMLKLDGVDMAYSTFCWAVAALRHDPTAKAGGAMNTGSTAPLPRGETAGQTGPAIDPLHNLKRLQNERPGFDYRGTLPDEELFGFK